MTIYLPRHLTEVTGGELSTNLSRSALRREKRKQKERLVADLSSLKSILELESSGPRDIGTTGRTSEEAEAKSKSKSTATATETVPGKIGESKRSKPLTKAQRKRAL